MKDTWTETRGKMLAYARKYPQFSDRNVVAALDHASPGWKRARITQIVGATDDVGDFMDLLYEIRGGVSLRAWDVTGAIHRRVRCASEHLAFDPTAREH